LNEAFFPPLSCKGLVLHEFKGDIRSLTLCFDCKIILFITSFILALGFLVVGFRWLVLASFVLEKAKGFEQSHKTGSS